MPEESTAPILSRTWLSLFPPIYLLHLLDERFFGDGTAAWASEHMGVYLTNEAWLVINVAWFLGLSLATWLVSRRILPEWIVASLATHLAIHALTRLWGSAVFVGWSPGVLSGVVVCLPWATVALVRANQRLPTRQLVLGVACGILSLQPLWDFFMLPMLMTNPPTA